jgi:hypothetical protein
MWGASARECDRHRARWRSAMRWHLALFLAASFAVPPLDGVAGEKPIADVKELAGSWRGWVGPEFGRERATMVVEEDGTYKASNTRGTLTQGTFSLRDGKLRYQSTRTTGTASLFEDQGKTVLTDARGPYRRHRQNRIRTG